MQLKDKTAFVTGADSGIGQAIAVALAEAGADVAITYHSDREGADETRRRIEAAGRRAFVLQLDVREEAAVDDAFANAQEVLGLPDILVNNAGMGSGGTPVAEMSSEQFDKVVRTDLYGPFFCTRAFLRRRIEAGGGGRIVNITSVHDSIPSPGSADYGAAKGGMLTFTRSVALEAAPHRINVNAIAPGMIATPMTQKRLDDPDTRARELPNIPWKRPGRPEEVARLAVYLASDDADYITGQSVVIDGGLEMNWGQGA
ncbi:SDR family oxidoreductase [Coralloluteibacterium stylophorae]|uniref:SDR family oxidoreductase n=1 Tax=Coralloluteibacterium stylophorae TaxID=1776034 RepID=A0A8J8AYH8_9GAMM|nr:SDR family oxidoreductase [Coralloluteibacterium stylophorae]MBS7455529.1 SDR family oxidoreductase [Coralloluteibacterium stylophorae]